MAVSESQYHIPFFLLHRQNQIATLLISQSAISLKDKSWSSNHRGRKQVSSSWLPFFSFLQIDPNCNPTHFIISNLPGGQDMELKSPKTQASLKLMASLFSFLQTDPNCNSSHFIVSNQPEGQAMELKSSRTRAKMTRSNYLSVTVSTLSSPPPKSNLISWHSY
jgi:hypothetical protein